MLKLSLSLSDDAFDPGACCSSLAAMCPVGSIQWRDWRVGPRGDNNFDIRIDGESRYSTMKASRFGFKSISSSSDSISYVDSSSRSSGVGGDSLGCAVSTLSATLSRYQDQ